MTAIGVDLQELVRRAKPERTLITTYCASLSYLESGLLSSLREHGRPSVRVLIDAQPYADCQGEVGVRYPGVRYETYAVSASGGYRFHPKTYALLSEQRATLIVASANLTVPGFRSNWEVFDVLQIAREPSANGQTRGDVAAFASYAAFLKRLADGAIALAPAGRRALIEISTDIRELLDDAEPSGGAHGPWFLHSVDEPLLGQIARVVSADSVERITAFSPYYDPGAEAVRRLARAFPGTKRTNIVLDPLSEPTFNGRSLRTQKLNVYRASSPEVALSRFLHAKLLVLETKTGAWTVAGSANLTLAGLCGAASPAQGNATGNIEAVTMRFLEDRTLVKRLLSAVPRTPWAEWQEATPVIQQVEPNREVDAVRVLDAEIESGCVRCIIARSSWAPSGRAPEAAQFNIDHQDERISLMVEAADEDGEFVVLEAHCENNLKFAGSDQPARIEVLLRNREGVRRGRAWVRRPAELGRSAASVTIRERLRPLRQTPTPSADTLLEVHSELCSLLSRLSDSSSPRQSTPGPSNSPPSAVRRAAGDGNLIDVSDLLRDDASAAIRSSVGNERPHDQLRAIGEALRAHLSGRVVAASSDPAKIIASRTGETADDSAPGKGRGATRHAARAAHHAKRISSLSYDAASELAGLAAKFSGAVRATPMTPETISTLIEMAEPVGTVVLCADVLRSPLDETRSATVGPREALRDAMVAWWAALLGVAPGSDGAPRGLLIRAWASDDTQPLLEAAIQRSSETGSGGLAGLAAGVAAARVVLHITDGDDALVDDAVIGLSLLSGDLCPFRSATWSEDARFRLAHATSWWSAPDLGAIIDSIWNSEVPPEPGFVRQLHRWRAVAEGVMLDGEAPALAQVIKAIAHVRQAHSDPIATLDPASRRTTCCPTMPTHTGFPGEVARGLPRVVQCPHCGRLVAPPEVLDPRTRRVAEWWDRRPSTPRLPSTSVDRAMEVA